jgi:hypothetical protein
MAKKRAISEIVGRAVFAGRQSGMVYRALRAIRCAACDQVIAEGELFTRRAVAGQGLRILPGCCKCAPFTFQSESKGTGHPMLDVLLTPEAEGASASNRKSDREERKGITEAFEQRLGPALQRCSRRRRR